MPSQSPEADASTETNAQPAETPTGPDYFPSFPMKSYVTLDSVTFYGDRRKPGYAPNQFKDALTEYVDRAVAEDRMERFAATMTAAKPPTPSTLAMCPECDGTGWHHVSMARGCGARRCDRCGGSGVVAARETEGEHEDESESTPVTHDEPAPAPEPAPTPRERLYRAFSGRATDADYDTAAQMLMASFKNADLATLEFVCGCLAGEQGGRR